MAFFALKPQKSAFS